MHDVAMSIAMWLVPQLLKKLPYYSKPSHCSYMYVAIPYSAKF